LFATIASSESLKPKQFGFYVELTASFGLANTGGKGKLSPIISRSFTFTARGRRVWLVPSAVDLPMLKPLR